MYYLHFIILILILFATGIIILLKKEKTHKKQLVDFQKKLQKYTKRIDNLMLILSNIHEFNIRTAGLSSREELAQYIINSACKLFDADIGFLMLLNHETNEFETTVNKNISSETRQTTLLTIGKELSEKVIQTGKPIFVEDITTDPRFSKKYNLEKNSLNSIISVPIETKGKICGTLTIYPEQKDEYFEEKNIHLLTILADQAAVALDNINLYADLQKFYIEFVEAFAKTVDVKDSYTFKHTERARKYARGICKELGLPESMTKLIEYASLVHDIGKIGIENHILEKPGKLTPEERKTVEKHPSIGSKIIENIALLSSIAPIVLYHQEWFNGQGYPEGLKNEEIPLGARIVAVIDAYDAMTSDRPYRKAIGKNKAIEELKKCSETQFDPQVVEAFLKIIEKENNV